MQLREGINAAIGRTGVAGLSRSGTMRAQKYVVRREIYRPFDGLSEWLSSRTDSEWLVARIGAVEQDEHEHKVFDIRERALLEHRRGFVFLRAGLDRESVTYWQLCSGPSPKAYRDYLLWIARRDTAAFLPVAVSLRARWEGNFWHCQDNVLSKLIAIDRLGLPDNVPLLVGKAFWNSQFFTDIQTLPAFRDRNWMLHDRPIWTERAIICLEGSFRRAHMEFAQRNLDRRTNRRAGDPASERRTPGGGLVVLARREGLERHVENGHEVVAGLARQGFSELDAEQLSLDERVSTFRNVRCVVLPVGAGLANLVHRIGKDCAVVEIIPANKRFAQPYGAWMCREFGFSYRAVVGSAVTARGSFTVDAAKVVIATEAVLREQPGFPRAASAVTVSPGAGDPAITDAAPKLVAVGSRRDNLMKSLPLRSGR